jgi:hypothetical protein
LVHKAENTLSDGVSLVGSLLGARHRLKVVLQTLACSVRLPKKTLSDGVSLRGRLSQPFNGLSIIPWHPSTREKQYREGTLSVGISLIRERAQKPKDGCDVPPYECGLCVFIRASGYARCKTR